MYLVKVTLASKYSKTCLTALIYNTLKQLNKILTPYD